MLVVNKQYYSNVLQIEQGDYPNPFAANISFTLSASNLATQAPMLVGLGLVSSLHRLAATAAALPGVYSVVFSKEGDPQSLYANFPPLQVVLVADKCSVSPLEISYTLPLGGRSLPIVLDFYNCLPVSDITFTATFSSPEVSLDSQLSTKNLTAASPDGRVFLVAVQAGPTLVAGSLVTMEVALSGTNALAYESPVRVTLTVVNNSTVQPTASSLPAVGLSGTTASASMQCSQPSTMYWAVALFPSLADLQSLSIQTNLTLSGNGLTSNRSAGGLNQTYYGVSYSSLVQPLSLRLPSLRAGSRYQLTYFCVNQMSLISQAASTTFSTPTNGGYLLKVNFTFSGNLTFAEYNSLACAMAVSFSCPAARLWIENAGYCSNYAFQQYADTEYPSVSSNVLGQFGYGFYVVPDYYAASDTLNAGVLADLSSLQYISQLLANIQGAYQLPSIVSIEPQSVLNTITPLLTTSQVFVSPTAMAMYASLSNANGYLVGAVLQGSFLPNYALPSAASLKAGVLAEGIPFLRVKSLYLPVSVNTTFMLPDLQPNTSYSLVYVATVDDPTLEATAGTVRAVNFSTTTLNTITIHAALGPVLLLAGWLLL